MDWDGCAGKDVLQLRRCSVPHNQCQQRMGRVHLMLAHSNFHTPWAHTCKQENRRVPSFSAGTWRSDAAAFAKYTAGYSTQTTKCCDWLCLSSTKFVPPCISEVPKNPRYRPILRLRVAGTSGSKGLPSCPASERRKTRKTHKENRSSDIQKHEKAKCKNQNFPNSKAQIIKPQVRQSNKHKSHKCEKQMVVKRVTPSPCKTSSKIEGGIAQVQNVGQRCRLGAIPARRNHGRRLFASPHNTG